MEELKTKKNLQMKWLGDSVCRTLCYIFIAVFSAGLASFYGHSICASARDLPDQSYVIARSQTASQVSMLLQPSMLGKAKPAQSPKSVQLPENSANPSDQQENGDSLPEGEEKTEKNFTYILKKKDNGDKYIIKKVVDETGVHKTRIRHQFAELKNGTTYYVDKKGVVVKGWKRIKKQYYYFDRKNGKMHTGKCKVDGIAFHKDGTVKQTAYNTEKIKVMMRARKVMERVTKKTDSKSAKLEKCFRWIIQFPYRRYRVLENVRDQRGWELDFANDMFIRKQGCCVSNASGFAFLAKECGYPNVYLCDDTSHGWAEINKRAFDPLFAESKSYSKNYNAPYSVYKLYPVNKKKI